MFVFLGLFSHLIWQHFFFSVFICLEIPFLFTTEEHYSVYIIYSILCTSFFLAIHLLMDISVSVLSYEERTQCAQDKKFLESICSDWDSRVIWQFCF